jgi:hypothetical protein
MILGKRTQMALPSKALALIWFIALSALMAIGYALGTTHALSDHKFLILLAVAILTARLKVKLPGLTGNMAVNLPFLLIAAAQLGMLQALMVAVPSCAVQCFPKGGGKPKLMQMIFNLSSTALAAAAGSLIGMRFGLPGVAGSFFLAQTILVAAIIRVTEGGGIHRIWIGLAHYSFPFYVLSAGMASIAGSSIPQLGWQVPLLALPALYVIYRSYQSYFREPSLVHSTQD